MSGFTALAAQGIALLALISLIGVIVGWSFGSLRASNKTSERYEQQIRAMMRRMSEAESDVVTLRDTLEQSQHMVASQSREHESREHLLAALEARLAEAAGAAEDASRASSGSEVELPNAAGGHNGAADAGTLEEILRRTSAGVNDRTDDLTLIKGIGGVTAATLNGLGITTYAQIARMTEADVDVVEGALDSFKGRIRRDDWVASAADLHRDEYGVEA